MSIRKIIAGVLIALAIVPLCGCHGARGLDPFVMPEEFDASAPCEITFWAKNDTNKTQTQIYEKAIDDFEKLYPNITVQLRLYTDYGRIYNDVITNIATNTTPNVCITYPDHIATYKTGVNVVVPLDDLMADPNYGLGGEKLRFDGPDAGQILPQFLNEGVIGQTQYALPFMRSTEACYINKTYVEKLGYTVPDVLTWDFVWEVSEAAMAKGPDGNFLVNGQSVLIPFIYKSTDNMMIQLLRQMDAPYCTPEGQALIFGGQTAQVLRTVAQHTKTGAFSTFKISSYPANFLNAGQCLFAVDSTAGATWMGSHAPLSDISPDKFVEFETEVRMIPQIDPENPQMISQGPSVCIFNKADPQQVLASWLFVQYLLTDSVQIAYAQTEGYVPVTASAQRNPAYQDYLAGSGTDDTLHYDIKIQAAQLLLDHVQDTFVTPVYNGSASLRDAAGQMIENVAKSVRRGETVDDAYLEKLYQDVAALYRLDQSAGKPGAALDGKTPLGPLPAASRALLAALAAAWALLIGFAVRQALKKAKSNREHA